MSGAPSAEEAAAVLAAVQVLLEAEAAVTPTQPWPYRSLWRQDAIQQGVNRADVP